MNSSEWAPSRFRLAMFRFIALVRLSSTRVTNPEETPRHLTFTGGQGPWEVKIVSAAWFIAFTLFVAAEIQHALGSTTRLRLLVPLFVLSIVIAFVVLITTTAATGTAIAILRRARMITGLDDAVIQAAVHHAILIAASMVSLGRGSWSRWIGLVWLSGAGLNLAAALVLRVVRRQVAEIEQRFGEPAQVPLFSVESRQAAIDCETRG